MTPNFAWWQKETKKCFNEYRMAGYLHFTGGRDTPEKMQSLGMDVDSWENNPRFLIEKGLALLLWGTVIRFKESQ